MVEKDGKNDEKMLCNGLKVVQGSGVHSKRVRFEAPGLRELTEALQRRGWERVAQDLEDWASRSSFSMLLAWFSKPKALLKPVRPCFCLESFRF